MVFVCMLVVFVRILKEKVQYVFMKLNYLTPCCFVVFFVTIVSFRKSTVWLPSLDLYYPTRLEPKLGDLDSNQDIQIQSLKSYR